MIIIKLPGLRCIAFDLVKAYCWKRWSRCSTTPSTFDAFFPTNDFIYISCNTAVSDVAKWAVLVIVLVRFGREQWRGWLERTVAYLRVSLGDEIVLELHVGYILGLLLVVVSDSVLFSCCDIHFSVVRLRVVCRICLLVWIDTELRLIRFCCWSDSKIGLHFLRVFSNLDYDILMLHIFSNCSRANQINLVTFFYN